MPDLPCQPTAIDRQDRSGHIIRSARSEKDDRPFQIVRFTPASRGDARQDGRASYRIGDQGCGVVRVDIAWRDRIHLNAARRPFVSQSFGQLANGSFAGCVARHIDATLKGQD